MFSREIILYHRSVRDFVDKDDKIQSVSRRFTALSNGDMFSRLRLAELWWYLPTGNWLGLFWLTLFESKGGPHIPGELVKGYLECLRQHARCLVRLRELGDLCVSMRVGSVSGVPFLSSIPGVTSTSQPWFDGVTRNFDHWAVYMSPDLHLSRSELLSYR